MNLKVLTVLLLIALISLDVSDAWGRRRRRGKGGWFRKTVKKVGTVVRTGFNIYKKYKPQIHTGINAAKTLWGLYKDQGSLDNIRTLKSKDQDSYLEFMGNMKDAFESAYPDLDSEEFVEAFDNMLDMERDESEEMERLMENDKDVNRDEVADAFEHLDEELGMRVAML